jgi:hypothetical protein
VAPRYGMMFQFNGIASKMALSNLRDISFKKQTGPELSLYLEKHRV